jgi:hypothetical protein
VCNVSKLEEENIPVPPFESKTNDSITDMFVTASEIVDFIQILDPKKASGPDKISHKMLKIAPEHFHYFPVSFRVRRII